MSPLKTPLSNLLILGFAGLCLFIALTIAWVLGVTLFFPEGALATRLVERDDVIRAHVDYLMMAQFLLLFFLGFRQYAIRAPYWLVGACGFGAFFNPLAFLMRGLTPKSPEALAVEPHFPMQAALSFSLTTVGFLGAVVLIACAAWRSREVTTSTSG